MPAATSSKRASESIARSETRYVEIANTILGEVVRRLGGYDRAGLSLREGLIRHRAAGQPTSVGQLLGAIQTLRDGLDTVETTVTPESDGNTLATLHARLTGDALMRFVSEGRRMTTEQASAEALAALDATIGSPDLLSP